MGRGQPGPPLLLRPLLLLPALPGGGGGGRRPEQVAASPPAPFLFPGAASVPVKRVCALPLPPPLKAPGRQMSPATCSSVRRNCPFCGSEGGPRGRLGFSSLSCRALPRPPEHSAGALPAEKIPRSEAFCNKIKTSLGQLPDLHV